MTDFSTQSNHRSLWVERGDADTASKMNGFFFSKFFAVVLPIIAIIILCTVTIVYNYDLMEISIFYPLGTFSSGDNVSMLMIVKRISQSFNWWYNPYLGGESGQYLVSYPFFDALSFLLIFLISRFVDNPFAIYNIFFFSTMYLCAFSAYFALVRMKAHPAISVTCAVLFAFLPFHMMRYYHLLLTPYFMIPLVVLVCVRLMVECGKGNNQGAKVRLADFKNYHFIVHSLIISILASSTGIYYAFFSCFFYTVVVVYALFQKRKDLAVVSVLCIGVVVFGVLANYLPNFICSFKEGAVGADQSDLRNLNNAEMYAMSLVTLLFPQQYHRSDTLAGFTQQYANATAYYNENQTAALGLVASIGFLILILILFRKSRKDDSSVMNYVSGLSLLNIAAVLLGVISGMGAVLSFVMNSALIRGYNRISVFIGFFALATIALLITKVFSARRQDKNIFSHCAISLVALVIVVFGTWDQTYTQYQSEDDQKSLIEQVESERSFFQQIESSVEDGAFVYECPYSSFPWGADYPLLKGYIFTDNLHWSYGGIAETQADIWNRSVSEMPAKEMIEYLRAEGYSGIYYDLTVYKALGKCGEDISTVNELADYSDVQSLVGDSIISDDGTKAFVYL